MKLFCFIRAGDKQGNSNVSELYNVSYRRVIALEYYENCDLNKRIQKAFTKKISFRLRHIWLVLSALLFIKMIFLGWCDIFGAEELCEVENVEYSRIPVYMFNNPDHDDVIKWKHFPRYWPFRQRIHRSPVNSPHKGQWRGVSDLHGDELFDKIYKPIPYYENHLIPQLQPR